VKVVNKIAASAAQLANCILLHAYSRTTAAPSCLSTNKNFIQFIQQAGITLSLVINYEQIKNKEAKNP